ncbi:Spo0E family sporulation regulatory protein-aspartic acid phosphatase [Neobacillus sp. Marseille-QA0830]
MAFYNTTIGKYDGLTERIMLNIEMAVEKLKLELDIEMLRQELICTGMTEGLTNKRTIEISQKLDQYILKYQSLWAP